jgi:hypothetical protein
MKSFKLAQVGVLAALGAWIGCGGNVVVDPANTGSGGSGGSGPVTSSSTLGGGTVSTTTSTGGVGGACALQGVPDPADCFAACSAIYDCGVVPCDGAALCLFTGGPDDKAAFMGDPESGCVGGCTQQPALINLVDVSDCATTIATLKSVSADFAAACDNSGCISCSEALDDNVSAICEESLTLYEAWVNCVCDGNCEIFCGDNLCSGGEWSPECQVCMMDTTENGCGQQLNSCLNDT